MATDTLIVELMRSTEWLDANEVEVGGWVRLAFEELKGAQVSRKSGPLHSFASTPETPS